MITEEFLADFQGLDTSSFEAFLVVAARRGANVVHFAPAERDLRVRYRLAGELRDVAFVAHAAGVHKPHPITMQIKAAAGLTLVGRMPGAGRFSMEVDGRLLSFRAATIPQVFGDRVVVRMFDLSMLRDASLLGYRPSTAKRLAGLLDRRAGVVVVAGPQGSGRTTTLYSLLTALNRPNREVSTVEDPVECYVAGINQVQLDPAGMDYPTAIRGVMRLDPEIVMVGETADPQTADLVFRMAMNGAQVLTSVTASSAVGAIQRLVELGVAPQRLAVGLTGVCAQVLLRRLCGECARPGRHAPLAQVSTCEPAGCPACRETGYGGFQSVQEVLEMTDTLKRRLAADLNEDDIRFLALSQGMETLKEDAVYKAVSGLIPLGEAVEVSDEPLDRIAGLIERTLRQIRGEEEVTVPTGARTRPSGLLKPLRGEGEGYLTRAGGRSAPADPGEPGAAAPRPADA